MNDVNDSANPRGGLFGSFIRGLAIVVVLGLGAWGAQQLLSVEREVPAVAHNHSPDHGGELEKKDGHAHGGEEHEGHSHEDREEHGRAIKLSDEQRENAKLTIETAATAKIQKLLPLNGIIQPNEEKTVSVLPRFGGIVRSMSKRLGERVKKNEIVARIESNESLTQYDLNAPIDGMIIERNGALGEYADKDKRIMVIADLSDVWVDFRVYSRDFNKLEIGQKIKIVLEGHDEPHEAQIGYLSPIGLTDTQSMLARAVVQNVDGGFLPGLFVTGYLVISEQAVAVAVKQSALQYIENKPVVFVEDEDGFEKREVGLGRKDHHMIEIVSGVAAGDKVVTGNSFILKAELGKGEAEHEH